MPKNITPAATIAEAERRRNVLMAGAVLLVATLLAYANSFSVPLIFDDWTTILHNPKIQKLWPIWAALSPPESTGVGGRPVANLSFVLNYAVSGSSMPEFHAVNLAIHFLAGLTLFAVVRRTLLRLAGKERGWNVTGLALAVAALWTLHPVQTQSVTYVSQRTELLMGLFYFLTLYGFVRTVEAGPAWRWPIFTVSVCVAGMASKEGMVTAPFMVLLYDYAFVTGSLVDACRRRWRLYAALAGSWMVLGLLMGGLRGRGVGFGLGMGAFSYLATECGAIMRYLGLALWPWPLVFDYGTDLGGVGVAEAWSAAGMFVIAGGTLWALWRRPAGGFLGAWFLVTLAPTSSIVPIPLQPISENRVYAPLAAIMAAVVFGLHAWLGRRAAPVFAAIAIALAGLTAARNRDYHSEVSIWADTVAKRPNSSRAHYNLGYALQAAGRLAEARTAYETALQLRPNDAETHLNLAGVLGRLGMPDAAVAHSQRAAELDPQNANAFYNLGVAQRDKGNRPAAIAAFEATLRLRPDFAEAHDNLALLLLRVDRFAEAIAHSEAAVRLNPGFVDARYNLACGLAMAGRGAEALPLFLETVRLRPNHVEAFQNLGITLQQLGRLPEAIDAYAAVLRLDPNYAGAHLNLGDILLGSGDFVAAANHYAAVLRASPNLARAHANLGIALSKAGRIEEAIDHLTTALRLDANSGPAREALDQLRPPRK